MSSPRRPILAELGGLCAALVVLAWAGGCVSRRGSAPWQVALTAASGTPAFAAAQRAVREAFPPAYRATHRAIITVRRRQFVCDGCLTVSPAEGCQLALISTLGLVTCVRVNADGSSEVLKVTPLFRETWAREYVARELRWLFAPVSGLTPAGRLGDGRLVLEAEGRAEGVKARYVCSADGRRWEELEVLNGGRRLLHAKISGSTSFPGCPRAVPEQIEVDAGTHQLQLRVVALSATTATGGAR